MYKDWLIHSKCAGYFWNCSHMVFVNVITLHERPSCLQGSHSNVGIKNHDFFRTFQYSTYQKSWPILVPFRASNNKLDNNNCNIWAQDAEEHTRNINCSTCNCKYTYKIASLVHHNWGAGWIDFSEPLWPKISTFSGPMSKFRTFQGLIFFLHFSGLFRTHGNPVSSTIELLWCHLQKHYSNNTK